MSQQIHTDSNEIIWGAEAIGAVIGLSARKTFHLLETSQLKGAKKIGRRWCISRRNLLANFAPPPTALKHLFEHLTSSERAEFLREVQK